MFSIKSIQAIIQSVKEAIKFQSQNPSVLVTAISRFSSLPSLSLVLSCLVLSSLSLPVIIFFFSSTHTHHHHHHHHQTQTKGKTSEDISSKEDRAKETSFFFFFSSFCRDRKHTHTYIYSFYLPCPARNPYKLIPTRRFLHSQIQRVQRTSQRLSQKTRKKKKKNKNPLPPTFLSDLSFEPISHTYIYTRRTLRAWIFLLSHHLFRKSRDFGSYISENATAYKKKRERERKENKGKSVIIAYTAHT